MQSRDGSPCSGPSSGYSGIWRSSWTRKLSFADLSFGACVDQMMRIQLEIDEEWQTNESTLTFWEALLMGEYNLELQPLAKRTLAFWIKVFNNWLKLRPRPNEEPPHVVSGLELQDILNIYPADHLYKVMRVFDPAGSKLLVTEGKCTHVLSKIKVVPVQIMTVGVCLSPWICSRNKIRFLLGLFDNDDSGGLNREQYLNLWKAWTLGMGKAFSVKPPHVDDFKQGVRATYDRLASDASEKLFSLAAGSPHTKETIVQAIKTKQMHRRSADRDHTTGKPEQVVCLDMLENIMMADASTAEPTFLMQNLAMLRFCAGRWSSLGQGFVEEFETLTYKIPVPVPKEPERVHPDDLPNRAEVVVVRDCCMEVGATSIEEIERAMETSRMSRLTDDKFKYTLVTALRELDTAIRLQGGYLKVLQKMYPRALPRHFKLFEQWCDEYDQLSQQESSPSDARGALLQYRSLNRKNIIPASDLERIKRDYQNFPGADLGAVEFDVIARYLGTMARDIAAKHDLDCDNHVSLPEFCRMMCPDSYRMPEMDGIGRQLFGKILELATLNEEKHLEHTRMLFKNNEESKDNVFEVSAFASMLEPVPEHVLSQWHAVFDELDGDADDTVSLSDLVISGPLSEPVCRYVVHYLDPHLQTAFTRDAFIKALLQAYKLRKSVHAYACED